MYERELSPRTTGADPHVHLSTTETFYVVEGQPAILCGTTSHAYAPGSAVVATSGVVHSYDTSTDRPVKVFICLTPGLGHEEFFAETAGPAAPAGRPTSNHVAPRFSEL